MRVTKRLDLDQLTDELKAAGVAFNGLGFDGTDTDGNIYTYINGISAELSAQGQAVVAAHVPDTALPIGSKQYSLLVEKTTINGGAVRIWRYTLQQNTLYEVQATVYGVSRTGSVKRQVRSALIKRLNGAPIMIGAVQTPVPDQADTAAASWTIAFAIAGNDVTATVTGQTGVTIDWSLTVDARIFKPGG